MVRVRNFLWFFIYIVSSLVWLAFVERTAPRFSDVAGAGLCLAGAALILYR